MKLVTYLEPYYHEERIGFLHGRKIRVPKVWVTEEMRVKFVNVDTWPTGLGEIGNPFIAPAIANAVFRLTGKRLDHLPFTPGRVLATLKA